MAPVELVHEVIDWPNKAAFAWHKPESRTIIYGPEGFARESDAQLPQASHLPPFDRARSTRRLCLLAVVVGWIVSIVCIAGAVSIRRVSPDWVVPATLAPGSHIVLALAFNIVASLITDCLGYIFATSLRWNLWRERRLGYNSNLRLFISSKSSLLNGWFFNALFAICLVAAYTAASQILITIGKFKDDGSILTGNYLHVNGVAVFAFGMAILLLSLISTLCIISESRNILSWSSNPITTTLACLHDGLNRREGRCMMSAQKTCAATLPELPNATQPSVRAVDPSVRYITRFAWSLGPLAFTWASAVLAVAVLTKHAEDYNGIGTAPPVTPSLFAANIVFTLPYSTTRGVTQTSFLFLVGGLQTLVTMGVHSIEVLANRSRDETIWRRAVQSNSDSSIANSDGAHIALSPFKTAVTSWQTMTLFAFKPIIHWLFGLGIYQLTFTANFVTHKYEDDEIITVIMSYMPLYMLGVIGLLLAIFATALARYKPKGPIPAAWGHLQTLADLIDDWGTDADGVLFWGDKGYASEGIRHAGTSTRSQEVAEVQFDQPYS